MYGYDIFHNEIMERLVFSVRKGTCSHAYIFAGEEGLGKLNAARLLANALVCESRGSAPCGTCPACVQAKARTNPDISYIGCGDKKSIGVEAVRKISEDVAVKPFGTGHKVYIITEGDKMTETAQNAFLKTLEEPPSYAVFIILCKSPDDMLDTVASRCETIRFLSVSHDTVARYAASLGAENADFLADFSQGVPGIAEKYLTDTGFRTLRENSVKMLRDVLSYDVEASYTVADFLEANSDNLSDILNFWLVLIRDMLLISHSDKIVNSDIKTFLRNQASMHGESFLATALDIIKNAHEMQARKVKVRAIGMYICLQIKAEHNIF